MHENQSCCELFDVAGISVLFLSKVSYTATKQAMADCSESILQEEIAVLQSIYMDEIIINGPEESPDEIVVMLHPYTADEDDKKYVYMQLSIKLNKKYPHVKPLLGIRNPRGISDAQLDSFLVNLNALATQKIGEAVLFDLIEYAKECLTDNNRPECDCAICLDDFKTDEDFVRTECYHYFHLLCMAQYVRKYLETLALHDSDPESKGKRADSLNMIPCPICRSMLKRELLSIDDVSENIPEVEKVDFKPSKKFLHWREKMKRVYAKQQKRGGIIDIEAERNKFLIQTKKDAVEPRRKDDQTEPDLVADSDKIEMKVTKDLPRKSSGFARQTNKKYTQVRRERKENYSRTKEIVPSGRREYDRPRQKHDLDTNTSRSTRHKTESVTDAKSDESVSGNPRIVSGDKKAFAIAPTKDDSRRPYRQRIEHASKVNDSQNVKEQRTDVLLAGDLIENKALRPPPGFKPR
eukprot:gene13909-15358_t